MLIDSLGMTVLTKRTIYFRPTMSEDNTPNTSEDSPPYYLCTVTMPETAKYSGPRGDDYPQSLLKYVENSFDLLTFLGSHGIRDRNLNYKKGTSANPGMEQNYIEVYWYTHVPFDELIKKCKNDPNFASMSAYYREHKQ
jgi:hypothetical protein